MTTPAAFHSEPASNVANFNLPQPPPLPPLSRSVADRQTIGTKLFDSILRVEELDPGGKLLEGVTVVIAKSIVVVDGEYEVVLHLPTKMFPLKLNDMLRVVVCDQLQYQDDMVIVDGQRDYDLVLRGKLFKVQQDNSSDTSTVLGSCGGLLFSLTVKPAKLLHPLAVVDRNVCLMLRYERSLF